jgi:HEAT repeat protein
LSVKDEIRTILTDNEPHKLVELASREKSTVRQLTSFLYNEDELLRWRAVEGFGAIAKDPYILSVEKLQTIISRLTLNLEDRSGGNAWSSLEAVGAIIAARSYQLENQIPKLFSFIHDARLWKGLLWSVRRIGEQNPGLLQNRLHLVIGLLRNPSNTTRGHAAWALGVIGDGDAIEILESLTTDKHGIRIYDKGELLDITVGELAKRSLDEIKAGPQHFKPHSLGKKPLRASGQPSAAKRTTTSRRRPS